MVELLKEKHQDFVLEPGEILYRADCIEVSYHTEHQYLYIEWIGSLNLHLVRQHGEKVLSLLSKKGCTKILNNNTLVRGPWLDACPYLAEDLLPRLKEAGLKYLAWVYSPNMYSQHSTDQTLDAANRSIKKRINIFYTVEMAQEWLNSNP